MYERVKIAKKEYICFQQWKVNGQSRPVTEYSKEWNTQGATDGMVLPRVKEASSIIFKKIF